MTDHTYTCYAIWSPSMFMS